MITINPSSRVNKDKLSSLLATFGDSTYTFNTNLIYDDTDKLEERKKETTNRIMLENIKRTIKYLQGILNKEKDGEIRLEWILRNEEVTSLPIEMRQIKMFGIQTTDYITLKKEGMLILDYEELIKIITFELTHRDLGFSKNDIEEALKDVQLLGVYDTSKLELFLKEFTYESTLNLMIGECSHLSPDGKRVTDYFGNTFEADKYYKCIVEHSRAIAMSIVIQELLIIAELNKLKIKIAGVFEDSIHLILPDGKDEYTKEMLTKSVLIKMFGRRFEVRPKVQMY